MHVRVSKNDEKSHLRYFDISLRWAQSPQINQAQKTTVQLLKIVDSSFCGIERRLMTEERSTADGRQTVALVGSTF